MKPILWMSFLWLNFVACLPADVCDPGQFQDEGNLCEPLPDSGLPDGGLPLGGGQDGGVDGG